MMGNSGIENEINLASIQKAKKWVFTGDPRQCRDVKEFEHIKASIYSLYQPCRRITNREVSPELDRLMIILRRWY